MLKNISFVSSGFTLNATTNSLYHSPEFVSNYSPAVKWKLVRIIYQINSLKLHNFFYYCHTIEPLDNSYFQCWIIIWKIILNKEVKTQQPSTWAYLEPVKHLWRSFSAKLVNPYRANQCSLLGPPWPTVRFSDVFKRFQKGTLPQYGLTAFKFSQHNGQMSGLPFLIPKALISIWKT